MTTQALPSQVDLMVFRAAVGRTRQIDMTEVLPNTDDLAESFIDELPHLYAFLERIGIARADREDLVHEVFLVFHRRQADFDRARPLRPWLSGIAYRTARDHWKRRRDIPLGSFDPKDDAATPDAEAEANEAHALVRDALRRLPLKQRAVFIMREIDGIDMLDVAKALGIPRFTAYSRLRAARAGFIKAVRAVTGNKGGAKGG